MNKIDYENIKKEIASRAVKFEEGGELSVEYIQRQDVSTLQNMLKDYDNDEQTALVKHLKKLVDDMFQKYGNEENNMIVLESVYAPERSLVDEDPLEHYYLDVRWNKIAHPVGMEWESSEYDDVFEDYNDMVDDIRDVLRKLDVKDAHKIFVGDDRVNECWSGVTAITRDYRCVYFNFRNDGILMNDKIYEQKAF